MIKLLKPAIERRYDSASPNTIPRKRVAERICRFLEVDSTSNHNVSEREQFYDACESLLSDRDYERILFYLPLGLLADAPETFREAYCNAWYRLLDVKDVRENFHVGDCFEPNARPCGGLERVAKCAHLTPWLLQFGYISQQQILDILDERSDDEILLQSFKDVWGYIHVKGILGGEELEQLVSRTTHLPERKKLEPLYVSEKRLKWLNECDKSVELLTPMAKLEGPFSDNIPVIWPQLEAIASRLEPSEIALIGGSQLKGYGTSGSDLDVWSLQQLKLDSELRPGSPHAAHIYFNTIWLGGETIADELEDIADRILEDYTSCARRQAIERLESDLLQYRLLHKGFARFTDIGDSCVPLEMDGDCPFYSDKYRRIATMLYAKYVWL